MISILNLYRKMKNIREYFYTGTSGLVLPFNKEHFPVDFQGKSRLEYYASINNSVEINSTFYKLPKTATIIKWAESVPNDFQFTFKIPKKITHSKGMDFSLNDVKEFIDVICEIGSKKGCLLVQFPPSIKIAHFNKVESLLVALNHANSNSFWKIAMEFRDSSWYISEVYEMLEEFNATMVLHDMSTAVTGWNVVIGNFVYLRLHGPEPRYRGDYSDEFLKHLAQQIKEWVAEEKIVYAYFNNTVGAAFKNMQSLNKYVGLL